MTTTELRAIHAQLKQHVEEQGIPNLTLIVSTRNAAPFYSIDQPGLGGYYWNSLEDLYNSMPSIISTLSEQAEKFQATANALNLQSQPT